MKITHNKVGQNLNLVDGAKTSKTEEARANSQAGRSNKVSTPESALGEQSAKVQVSDRAQEAKRIKEMAMSAPDVDQAKVEKFRRLIDEGKYKVDSKSVADKMVDEHMAMATE